MSFLSSIQNWLIFFKEGLFLYGYSFDNDNSNLMTFNNIPELLLAPSELEFSETIIKEKQYYLGLCIDIKRKFSVANREHFELQDQFLSLKKRNKKIIYVSFGTYFTNLNDFTRVASFLIALNEAIKDESNFVVVVATNQQITESVKSSVNLGENLFLLNTVPQLEILSIADLFVTHGGLGSIKESIYFKVPMLVFPLDYDWDQNGNGLKVEYHKIGLRGDIDLDEPHEIYRKIGKIINCKTFYDNIKIFSDSINIHYNESYFKYVLQAILK